VSGKLREVWDFAGVLKVLVLPVEPHFHVGHLALAKLLALPLNLDFTGLAGFAYAVPEKEVVHVKVDLI
jgi:hypothetical protein